jgi:hypothetical protein
MSMGFRFLYVGDNCNYNASGVVLHVGGNYNQNRNHGLFYLNGNNAASNQNTNIGSLVLVFLIDGYGASLNHRWVEISHTSW